MERIDSEGASAMEGHVPAGAVGRRTGAHWLSLAAALVGLLALVVLRLAVEPDPRGHGTHEQLGLPPCASMELFDLPCPGCGVTTATAWAVRGELVRALAVQPFGLVVAAGTPLFAAWCLLGLLRGRDLGRELERTRKGPWIVLGALLLGAAWLYRLALLVTG